jgi:hypothetical protein
MGRRGEAGDKSGDAQEEPPERKARGGSDNREIIADGHIRTSMQMFLDRTGPSQSLPRRNCRTRTQSPTGLEHPANGTRREARGPAEPVDEPALGKGCRWRAGGHGGVSWHVRTERGIAGLSEEPTARNGAEGAKAWLGMTAIESI